MELIKVQVKDDQQLVSARDLYKALEIKKRFSAWVEQNFRDFEEHIDFTSVPAGTVVNNGAKRELQDYALTIDMAKQLCLLSRTEKGKQYRKYLISVEKKYRENQLDMQELSPELQMFSQMLKVNAEHERKIKRLDQKVDNITEIVSLNTTEWRKTAQGLIHKMAKTEGGFGAYQQIQGDIYKEVDARAGSSLKTRLTNLRQRMALNGSCKSAIDRLNRLDVIDADKRLKQIYMAVVKDFAIKYKVWEKEY
ncbi:MULTISPECIES: antA/AntB antirepressor family protein [unclassified Lactobacillus]|uniref:antA/AntB antirepressor family protein n=1 Tax=unclassified Lactobacillus TaxID=2620435 RepID=UPI001F31BAB1|nr:MULTISPECIES: antA/AntB antirepressor family protein [unclassified Lactobacillus]